MEIAEAIAKSGTEAVRRYRAVAGLDEDSHFPEVALGGLVAGRMHDLLGINARVEHPYTQISEEYGIPTTSEIAQDMGQQRVDLALYRNKKCFALVEFKKFEDWSSATGILRDKIKLSKLSALCGVDVYLGVFVTDTERGQSCNQRIEQLVADLGRVFDFVGDEQASLNGK